MGFFVWLVFCSNPGRAEKDKQAWHRVLTPFATPCRHERLPRGRGSTGGNQRQNRSTGAAPIHTVQSPVTMQDKTPAKEVGNYHNDTLLLHGCQGAYKIPLEEVHSSLGSLGAAAALSSNRIKLIFKMPHTAQNKKFASPRKVPLSPKEDKQMYQRKKNTEEISNKQNTTISPQQKQPICSCPNPVCGAKHESEELQLLLSTKTHYASRN